MRHSAVIYLLSKKIDYDELAQPIITKTERMVFANPMTVSMKEFYEAGNSGINPEKQFEIYSFEYNGESTLKSDGTEYRIVRTAGKGDKLRIICERVVGNG